MKSVTTLLYGLIVQGTLVIGSSIPRFFETNQYTRSSLNSKEVQLELSTQVSNTTVIFGPNDSRFPSATARWNMYAVPQVQVVIEPGQESDVAIIVRYCSENSIEFLATNRGHGNPVSLASFNGIAINLVNLQSISIQPDGASAWFGGGTYDGQVNEYLWDEGYMATTGSCDCVGLLGAGLGGGHGRLEGLYGMVSDNFLQLNVVLGSGDAIVVNSTQHSHLLWGMKGAGHNFGIVTSFEMKIYPRGPDLWHYHNYVWRGEKLEDVFNALNNLQGNGTTPVNMTVNFGNFFMNTSITTEEPIIFWTFAYRGTAEEANQYLDAFTAIDYVFDEYGDVPYKEIASKQQTGVNDVICQHGNTRITSTAGLQVYNLTAERQIFDGFTRRLTTHPDLAAGCGILHEGYATAAVDAQNPDDSAYPFRSDHHLMLFDLVLPSGSNIYTEQAAWDWAFEVRDQWNNGQPERPVNAYVNYANGMESLGEKYGHEAWRLKKLWELKIKYDPFNRFRFYNPIVGV